MKRLMKKSEHDYDDRDRAITCINGKTYEGGTHVGCINQYLAEIGEQQKVKGYKRPNEDIAEGNIKGLDKMAFAHLVHEGWERGIYLEENSLINMTLDEAANIIKASYPDFSIFNDDKEVENYWQPGFEDVVNQYQLIVAKSKNKISK